MGLFDFLFKRKKKVVESSPAKTEEEAVVAPVDEPEVTETPKEEAEAEVTEEKAAEVTIEEAPKKPKSTTPRKKKTEAPAPAEDKIITEEQPTVTKATRTGKFEIKKSKDGRYVFNLYASNHVIVATSQIYSSSQSAMNGIRSVIANAGKAPIEDQTVKEYMPLPYPKWELYLDKGNQYRFRLSAPNGSCVCHSQGYTSKSSCKKGIESIIKFATDAEISKAYLKKDDE